MYKDDSETKAVFVQELSQLFSKYEIEDIGEMFYSNIDGKEKVTIFFKSGGVQEVNVSMDSLPAMVRDIMKSLK